MAQTVFERQLSHISATRPPRRNGAIASRVEFSLGSPPVRAHLWSGRYGPCAEGSTGLSSRVQIEIAVCDFLRAPVSKRETRTHLGTPVDAVGSRQDAPAASARGKDLGPCGDEVSGHGGARQHGGLRADGCGVRPASLQYGARTAMRRLASRLSLTVRGGGWLVYTQSQRRDHQKFWSMSRLL